MGYTDLGDVTMQVAKAVVKTTNAGKKMLSMKGMVDPTGDIWVGFFEPADVITVAAGETVGFHLTCKDDRWYNGKGLKIIPGNKPPFAAPKPANNFYDTVVNSTATIDDLPPTNPAHTHSLAEEDRIFYPDLTLDQLKAQWAKEPLAVVRGHIENLYLMQQQTLAIVKAIQNMGRHL